MSDERLDVRVEVVTRAFQRAADTIILWCATIRFMTWRRQRRGQG